VIIRPGIGDENGGGGGGGRKAVNITEAERFGRGLSVRPCCIYFDNRMCCKTWLL